MMPTNENTRTSPAAHSVSRPQLRSVQKKKKKRVRLTPPAVVATPQLGHGAAAGQLGEARLGPGQRFGVAHARLVVDDDVKNHRLVGGEREAGGGAVVALSATISLPS